MGVTHLLLTPLCAADKKWLVGHLLTTFAINALTNLWCGSMSHSTELNAGIKNNLTLITAMVGISN
jgi:hypothetical protein